MREVHGEGPYPQASEREDTSKSNREKLINDWTPGKLLIGTGDPDAPELVPYVDLPRVWSKPEPDHGMEPTR